jgi:hypothetical protein
MAGPRISEQYKYMTVPQAAERLGIHPAKLRRRLKDDIFPTPTYINNYGLSFFDEAWLKKTQAIFENSFENQQGRQGEG